MAAEEGRGDQETALTTSLGSLTSQSALTMLRGDVATTTGPLPIVSDAPVASRADDLLGRAQFAEDLAHAILKWQSDESVVIGLFGGWGTGKTSILLMTEEALDEVGAELGHPFSVFRFNPWSFTDETNLLTKFLREFLLHIGKEDTGARLKAFGRDLKLYAQALSPAALASDRIEPAIAVGMLAAIGAWVLQLARREKDVESVRARIDNYMRSRNAKVLVVVDDIDRLNRSEIRHIFQLIKLNANFPNTMYVLDCDPQQVSGALSDEFGDRYLDKIVQVPLDVPRIRPEFLKEYFLAQVDEAVRSLGMRIDVSELSRRYNDVPPSYLTTLRDVKRVINAIRFTLAQVSGDVNPSDFVMMEVIRVFDRGVHDAIWRHKKAFSGLHDTSLLAIERESIERAYEMTLEEAQPSTRTELRNFLRQLFPRYDAHIRGSSLEASFLDQWGKEKRVCSPSHFDTYYVLKLAPGSVSMSDFEEVLAASSSDEAFRGAVRLLFGRPQFRELMTLMEYHYESIPEGRLEPVVLALLDVAELTPFFDVPFGRDSNLHVLSVVSRLIHRLDDWVGAAQRVCEHTSALYSAVRWIRMEEGDFIRTAPSEAGVKRFAEIGGILLRRIEQDAEQGTLPSVPRFLEVLYSWAHWDSDEAVRRYIHERLVTTPGGLAAFLFRLLAVSWVSDTTTRMEIGLVIPEPLASIDEVRSLASQLPDEFVARLSTDFRENFQLIREKLESDDFRVVGGAISPPQ